jgi:hypothetical protein
LIRDSRPSTTPVNRLTSSSMIPIVAIFWEFDGPDRGRQDKSL